MYNLYDNDVYTSVDSFLRREAFLSNIMREHHFHKTMMTKAKSKWVCANNCLPGDFISMYSTIFH